MYKVYGFIKCAAQFIKLFRFIKCAQLTLITCLSSLHPCGLHMYISCHIWIRPQLHHVQLHDMTTYTQDCCWEWTWSLISPWSNISSWSNICIHFGLNYVASLQDNLLSLRAGIAWVDAWITTPNAWPAWESAYQVLTSQKLDGLVGDRDLEYRWGGWVRWGVLRKMLYIHACILASYLVRGGRGGGGWPPPQLEHWGGKMPPPPPPTLGYNTQGCLRVHHCLYSVTVYTGWSHIIMSILDPPT